MMKRREQNPHKKTERKIERVKVKITRDMETMANDLGNALFTEKTIAVRVVVGLAVEKATAEAIYEVMTKEGYHLNTKGFQSHGDNPYPATVDLRLTESQFEWINLHCEQWEVTKVAVIRALYQWGLNNLGNYTLADLLEKAK